MINDSGALEEIYNYNCKEIQEFVKLLLNGLKEKAKQEEINEIFSQHLVTLLKLWSVGFYEDRYSNCMKLEVYQKLEEQNNLPEITNLSITVGSP